MPTLNRDFIHRKIKLIQEDLHQLEPLAECTRGDLLDDLTKYYAVERLLERIITRAIDINRHCITVLGKGNEVTRTYEDTFLRLGDLGVISKKLASQIAPSAGLRNILVHEYDEVDPRQVYASVGEALSEFTQYCGYLLKFLAKKNH